MKVLIVNTQWTGASTGKIAYGFYQKLKENGHEAILAYGIGVQNTKDRDVRKVAPKLETKIHFRYNLLTGYHGTFGPIAYYNLRKIVEKFKPDIVQLYNLHGHYMNIFKFMDYLAMQDIPVVYGMLDEYPYLGCCCYAYDCENFKHGCTDCHFDFSKGYMRSLFFNRARKTVLLKKKNYDNFKKIVFTGPYWVIERAKTSYLLKNKDLKIVDEYVDTENTFYVRDTTKLREKLGISKDTIVILDVAPSKDTRKGIKYFVELAIRMEKRSQNVLFINVGYQGNFTDLPSNFIGIPFISDQDELAEYYSMADLFVCTSMADTMPNTCLDALACGTPICGFKITGIPYVADEPVGRFVLPEDINALQEIAEKTEKKTREMEGLCRDYAVRRYSLNTYYSKQLEIYHELLKGVKM